MAASVTSIIDFNNCSYKFAPLAAMSLEAILAERNQLGMAIWPMQEEHDWKMENYGDSDMAWQIDLLDNRLNEIWGELEFLSQIGEGGNH